MRLTRRSFLATASCGSANSAKAGWTIRGAPRITGADTSAPEPVRWAAAELDRYLTSVFGGRRDGRRTIALGIIDDPDLGDEGYQISARGNTLAISGGGATGIVYGVFEFLRRFAGCRFSGVAKDCEYVPRLSRIDVPLAPLRRRPLLWYRGYQFFYKEPAELVVAHLDWMVKNGLNYVMFTPLPDDAAKRYPSQDPVTGQPITIDPVTGGPLDRDPLSFHEAWFRENVRPEVLKRGLKLDFNHHNLFCWMPPERYFAQHPDWYTLIDGKRVARASQLAICTSNEAAVETLIQNVKRYLRENPQLKIVGVIPEDGYGMCQCDACVRGDPDPRDAFRRPVNHRTPEAENRGKSIRYAKLINRVARAIREEFPGVLVGQAAYIDIQWPPRGIQLEPNIVTWVAIYWRDAARALSADTPSPVNRFFWDILRQWKAVHPGRLIVYEYYMGMSVQRSLPYPMAATIARDWPQLRRLGIQGATIQGWSSNHNSYGLNHMVFARCGWDGEVDVTATLDDYLLGMFGSAGRELRPVFQRLERGVEQLADKELLPNGQNVQYFLEQIDNGLLDSALTKARAAATEDRERRQLEHFSAIVSYWRRAASAISTQLQASEAEKKGDALRAAALYERAVKEAADCVNYVDSLPPRGWIAVNATRSWHKEIFSLRRKAQELRAALTPLRQIGEDARPMPPGGKWEASIANTDGTLCDATG